MTQTKPQAMTEWFTDYLTKTTEGSPEVMPTPLLDSIVEDDALRQQSPLLMAAIEQEVRTSTRSTTTTETTVKTTVKKTRYSKTPHCTMCGRRGSDVSGVCRADGKVEWILTPIVEE